MTRVHILCLLGLSSAAVAQTTSASSIVDGMQEFAELVWEQYKDKLPSCDESTYVSKAAAEASYACSLATNKGYVDSAGETCSEECTNSDLLNGVECQREDAMHQASLAAEWSNLLKTKDSLPTGKDGQILEVLVATLLKMSNGNEAKIPTGFTASGGAEFLSDPKNKEFIQAVYENLALQPEIVGNYIEQCVENAAVGTPSTPATSTQTSDAASLPVTLLMGFAYVLWTWTH